MISEKDVLDALNRFEDRIKQLKLEKEALMNDNSKKELTITQLADERTKLLQENQKLKEDSSIIKNSLQEIKDKLNEVEKIKQENKELTELLKSSKEAIDTDLNVDSMMTKIKENDVKTSVVDDKLNEIKSERFTERYEWGRASKRTLNMFIDFVNALWYNAPKVNNLYILTSVDKAKGILDEESLNTFLDYLYKKGFVAKRDNETVSQFPKELILKNIEKTLD